MSKVALPFGTALALAHRALTSTLTDALRANGITDFEWFTLNALGLRGPQLPAANLSALLVTNGVDAADSDHLLAGLASRGLVERVGSDVLLSAEGGALYERLRSVIDASAGRVFDRFDPERVEAVRSLLQDIAELDGDQITQQPLDRANQR